MKLARALERVGRKDDALDALMAVVANAEARREIARLAPPIAGNAGAWFDVAPIERAPRVKWERSVDGRAELFASPLGLIVQTRSRIAALDPGTGIERWNTPFGASGPTSVIGEVCVLRELFHLEAHDLFDGAWLWRDEIPVDASAVALTETCAVFAHHRLIVRPFTKHRSPPARASLDDPIAKVTRIGTDGDAIVLQLQNAGDFVVVDAKGVERFRERGICRAFDARGFVVERAEGSLALFSRDGELAWATEASGFKARALAPDFVVADRIDSAARLVAIDRATGATTQLGEDGAYADESVVVARDTAYLIGPGGVTAYRLDGRKAWSIDLDCSAEPACAVLGRRLYVVARSGIVCLEEPRA